MLNTKLRKKIEWHFFNYGYEQPRYDEKAIDIIESGLTANYDRAGEDSTHSNPTENKAIELTALTREMGWLAVVRNTFRAYRFAPEHSVMTALYIDKIRRKDIIKNKKNKYGLCESTFWLWRDRWLTTALMWAKEYKLL